MAGQALLALALVASSCGGVSDGATADADGVQPPSGASAPFEVQALGALAEPAGPPIVTTFDSGAGSIAIDEDASLVVPAGAFGDPTEVTVQVFNLAFDDYMTDAPEGNVYVVSTVDEVALGTPVLLEVSQPSQPHNVMQYTDEAWAPVAVEAGERTVVPIKHFSTVSTAVVEQLAKSAAARTPPDVRASDATFLRSCIWGVGGVLGALSDSIDNESRSQAEFASDLAFSVCTTALVERATPAGRRVSTACVGDKIDGDTDFRGAIDECLADQDGAEAATGEAAEETTPDEPVGNDPAEAPSGPIEVRGTATTGAIANGTSDDLFSVDFVANIEGSTAMIDATIVMHHWFRGGPEDPPFEDQNCGVTYQHAIHFEGPSGNPTVLRGTVDASTILEVQGVLCDSDDDQRRLLDIGDMVGRFEGKANGLGVDGEISLDFRSIAISAAG